MICDYDIVSYVIYYEHPVRYRMFLPRQITFFEDCETTVRDILLRHGGFVKNCNRKNIELEKYLLNKKAGNEACQCIPPKVGE